MNGVSIYEEPQFLAPIPSETMHVVQLENPFNTTHQIIIPLKLNEVNSYFKSKMPTWEEYKDQNMLKIKLTVEAPSLDLSSPEYSCQKQSMFNYRGRFISPNTPGRV